MWSSSTVMFGYKTEHLVKTGNNLRISTVISLYGLTGTYNGVTSPIGPLCKYFVLWQMSLLPTYSLKSQEQDKHWNLSVRAFIVFSIPPRAVATWAFAIAISRKFLPSVLKVLDKTSLYYLFSFWTYRNPVLSFIFFLLFSDTAEISFQIGHT